MTTQPVVQQQPQIIIVRSEKSVGIAYALWFFLGTLGIHRFYTNKVGTGIAMAVLTCSVLGLIVTLPWWVVDAFLTGGLVRSANAGADRPMR